MPKTIKYIGTQARWPELPVTGKQSVWFRGQTEERSDTDADLLLASGLFDNLSDDGLNASQVAALQQGKILAADGGLLANSEATPYVTMTATGTAFSGPCELAGWYCSVAAGTITIYDGTSATGTPIVPATALVVGPMPIFGAGTNGRLQLTAGCHVVLSGAATVRVAVGV